MMSTNRRIYERTRVAAAIALALVPAQRIVYAQSILECDDWMQKIDRCSQSVQRNLARRDASAASADAREIAELYGSMETFFNRKGISGNAIKLSREGRELAVTVMSTVAGNDFTAATQAALGIAHACRTCHLQYKPLD